MATRRERPNPLLTSRTPFRDALRAALERRTGMPWQEALAMLRAGVRHFPQVDSRQRKGRR